MKGLYDKYEVDMEMFDYIIEPYLSYAVNTLPPKYAPNKDQNIPWVSVCKIIKLCYVFKLTKRL